MIAFLQNFDTKHVLIVSTKDVKACIKMLKTTYGASFLKINVVPGYASKLRAYKAQFALLRIEGSDWFLMCDAMRKVHLHPLPAIKDVDTKSPCGVIHPSLSRRYQFD